jgi:hypothetical protein
MEEGSTLLIFMPHLLFLFPVFMLSDLFAAFFNHTAHSVMTSYSIG